MRIELVEWPNDLDWKGVRRRAMVTMYGQNNAFKDAPSIAWRRRILEARHSPIRYIRFSFALHDVPANVTTHLCRHVHAQAYVSSLRNDRQSIIDGDAARRDTPVEMILDINAEELMVIANKRLCMMASEATREVVTEMCEKVLQECQEFKGLLVPMCEYHGGVCHEMASCGRFTR